MSETWPSFGHNITRTMVSVRNEAPVRLSDPISKKLIVLLSVSAGKGVGPTPEVSGTGGAAEVGKRDLRSTVGLGSAGAMGVGDAVGVGKNGSSVGTSMKYSEVGVACSTSGGRNGVGVGDAFGALVTRTKDSGGVEAGAAPQDVSNNASRKMNLHLDDFMRR